MRTAQGFRGRSIASWGVAGTVVAAGLLGALPATAASSSAAADPVAVRLAPDLSGLATFGRAVSVSGDTLLVGAPDDDAVGNGSGSVTVYVFADGTWSEQARLVADDGGAGDAFGDAVAVDGDTAVIGASYDSDSGTYVGGAAYVFVRSGETWTQQAKLDISRLRYYGNAGWSVALEGDTAVVGNPGGGLGSTGSVSVFTRSGTTWTERAILQDTSLDELDGFGSAVALDAGTLVVGQVPTSYLSGSEQHQAAYVYVGSRRTWTQQAVLKPADLKDGDWFGASVDVSADTVVVGADSHAVDGVKYAGSAYVFTRSETTWTEQAELVASEPHVFDTFGSEVAIDRNTIAVGAYSYDSPGAGIGALFTFQRSGTEWTQRHLLLGDDDAGNLGSAVDLDRQAGVRTLVGGAMWSVPSGAAYVYRW